MKLDVSVASSVACASPVRTCVPGGRICLDLADSCSRRDPGFAARGSGRAAALVEERLGRRQVEAGERRAAEARRAAELHEPGDAHPLHRPVGLDADRVADLEVLLAGGRLVDDDLVRARATCPSTG